MAGLNAFSRHSREGGNPATWLGTVMEKQPAVYIMAKDRNATLYTGVTGNHVGRTWLHREHVVDGFTKRYDIGKLVWFEVHGDMFSAITREKQIKKWNRAWKIKLIEDKNPYWNDLWIEITGQSKVTGFPPSRE